MIDNTLDLINIDWSDSVPRFYQLVESWGMQEYMDATDAESERLQLTTEFAYAGLCLSAGLPYWFTFGIQFFPLFMTNFASGSTR